MGLPILIIGKSGSGKSSTLRNYAEDEITLVNVAKKLLPFPKNFHDYHETDDYNDVMKAIDNGKDTVVIDDAGYLLVNMFMRGHSKGGGGNQIFAFYNQIADNFWNLIQHINNFPSKSKIVFLMMHEDKNDFGESKPKTIGKLLDDKVCIEGLFTIVLRSMYNSGRYIFRTATDGMDVTKTPPGIFKEAEIDNDLKFVENKIRSAYRLETKTEYENKGE